jgi:hypothetical protein
MRTLSEINQTYEEIIHLGAEEPYRSQSLSELMTEIERENLGIYKK